MHFRFLPFFGLSISSRSKCGHKGEQQQLKMHCVRKEGKKIFWLFLSQAVLITENFFLKSKQSQHFCFAQKFGNPSFETPEKQNVFNFQLTCFSAIVNFILWFCTSLSNDTWSFELISQLLLFDSQQQKLFKTGVLTQTDTENPQKTHFKPEKGHFRVYFNRATVNCEESTE